MEAVIHADTTMVRSRIGTWATVEEMDGARCTLRVTADSLDWVMMVLGAVGAEFEVVSPPAVIDHARDWMDRFGRAIGRHGPSREDSPSGAPRPGRLGGEKSNREKSNREQSDPKVC